MSKVNIKYLGGIEDEKYGASLTGSATLMNAEIYGGIKVLFDYGMFQGGKNEGLLNEKTDKEAISADFIVITHAHMDHIGRLPLLVKKGFKGKIIMSGITKQLMKVMLSDYVKLTTDKIESLEKENKNKGLKLRECIKVCKLDEELRKNGLTKREKEAKQKALNKSVGTNNKKEYLSNAKGYLKKINVKTESDIEEVLNSDIPTLLYNMEDIFSTMNFVQTLEVGNELDLTDHIVITNGNSKIVNSLPAIVRDEGYNRDIYITPALKGIIIAKWNLEIKEIYDFSKKNKELRNNLRIALGIFNKEENYLDNNEYSFDESKKILEEYNIKSRKDIEQLKENIPDLPYTEEDIEKAKSLLKVVFNNPNEKVVESFKLQFLNAGHIEGSVQAVITLVTKQIQNIVNSDFTHKPGRNNYIHNNVKKQYQNFLFTGDLGKFTDANISGTPDISQHRLDYVQCESTYATRNHPDKLDEFNTFINEINSAEGKVLIPAFSLQRTQEIILELLQNKKENLESSKKIDILNKEYRKINKSYDILLKIDNLSEEEQSNKEELFIKLANIKNEITKLSQNAFLGHLLIDSPLSRKVKDIYIENLGDKYKLLDPLIQKELFGKEIVRTLERGEYKNLYKGKRAQSKDIILSSGGMLQGGAITNHLKEIISDPTAKIIFTGYQSPSTLGGKIVGGDKEVIIDGEIYSVKCSVVQVKGYSSHIGGSDIEKYLGKDLKYSKGAKVVLNHGGETRKILAETISNTCKRVNVIVPELYDTVQVGL